MQVVDASEGYRTIDVALIAPEGVTPEVMRAMAHSVVKHAYVGPGSLDDAIDLPTRVLDGATQLVTTRNWLRSRPPSWWRPTTSGGCCHRGRTTARTSCGCSGPRTATSCCSAAGRRSRAERTRPPRCCVCRPRSPSSAGNHEAAAWVGETHQRWDRLDSVGPSWDADAVAAMHDRSSERSRYQRYFSIADWRGTRLYRLAGGHRGVTLVVMVDRFHRRSGQRVPRRRVR